MDVSKLTINEGLLKSPVLTSKRKRELRILAITDFIKANPGKRIYYKQIAQIGNFPGQAGATNAKVFIDRMIRWGILTDKYTVIEPLKVWQAYGLSRPHYSKKKPVIGNTFNSVIPKAIDLGEAIGKLRAASLQQEKARGSEPLQGDKAEPHKWVPVVSYTLNDLERLGMRYEFYSRYAGGTSVPGFLTWLKEQEKA